MTTEFPNTSNNTVRFYYPSVCNNTFRQNVSCNELRFHPTSTNQMIGVSIRDDACPIMNSGRMSRGQSPIIIGRLRPTHRGNRIMSLSPRLSKPTGVHRDFLEMLPVEFYTRRSINLSVCDICQADYIQNDKIRRLACLHFFHVQCIDPWLQTHETCPICRLPVIDTLEQSVVTDEEKALVAQLKQMHRPTTVVPRCINDASSITPTQQMPNSHTRERRQQSPEPTVICMTHPRSPHAILSAQQLNSARQIQRLTYRELQENNTRCCQPSTIGVTDGISLTIYSARTPQTYHPITQTVPNTRDYYVTSESMPRQVRFSQVTPNANSRPTRMDPRNSCVNCPCPGSRSRSITCRPVQVFVQPSGPLTRRTRRDSCAPSPSYLTRFRHPQQTLRTSVETNANIRLNEINNSTNITITPVAQSQENTAPSASPLGRFKRFFHRPSINQTCVSVSNEAALSVESNRNSPSHRINRHNNQMTTSTQLFPNSDSRDLIIEQINSIENDLERLSIGCIADN